MSPLERWLKRAASFVVHGGAWRLRGYETTVLQAAMKSLSAADAEVLEQQLKSLEHLKRLHGDRMVTFYFFDAERLPRISLLAPEHCIAQFRIKSPQIDGLRASVITHQGLLSSLEFSKTPQPLAAAAAFELLPAPTRPRKDLASEVDREEHP